MLKLRVAGELRRIARLEVCDNIFVGFSKCKGTSAMLSHLKYTEAVRQLAGMARQNAMDRDALYHGTRFAEWARKVLLALQGWLRDQSRSRLRTSVR